MASIEEIRDSVRDHYASVATGKRSCCSPETAAAPTALQLGYPEELLHEAPAESNLGLGCGNPLALADLKRGETVLDLGSGAGFDCFLAAREVGETGNVIGVDMTPDMLARARENAKKVNARGVEFRLGEIEYLPVADETIDVIISNCVINLSPDKPRVFREAHRVLRQGGRLAVSDIILRKPLPEALRHDLSRYYAQCIAGAAAASELEAMLAEAGFDEVSITPRESSSAFISGWSSEFRLEDFIVSADIRARKRLSTT